MANKDIKLEIKNSNLKQWQVSDMLKMQESNFSKMLRKELCDDKKAEIRAAITKLKEGEK